MDSHGLAVQILTAIAEIANGRREDDVLLVYWSGHARNVSVCG
jgi:hypothetical protein